ncbi:MAG: saccharopine dehydrogenase family protein, partial [Chitinophagales bacterium]
MIIGAGGVGQVVAMKCAEQVNHFSEILLASRTKSKCDLIQEKVLAKYPNTAITTASLDADIVEDTIALIESFNPFIVINVALPYQDLAIMDACLATRTHYLDTANYEPKDVAKFEYSWQWAYHERFKEANIMALLGCGFDPGQTQIYTAHAAKHHFDEIH